MDDKRIARRYEFSEQTEKKINCHLNINQKNIDAQVTNLSLAGMSLNIPAENAQDINNNIVISCTLSLDSEHLVNVKGQPIWNHPTENTPAYHSVGFYNFIPSENDHRILVNFLTNLA